MASIRNLSAMPSVWPLRVSMVGDRCMSRWRAFGRSCSPEFNAEQFADMYAQTVCYGLFAARNAKPTITFTRDMPPTISKTNPFLRKMFGYLAGQPDESIVWAVDDLAEVLNRSDIGAILRDFGKRTRRKTPLSTFTKRFSRPMTQRCARLAASTTRRNQWFPTLSEVDYLLKKDFGLPDGLADATKSGRPARMAHSAGRRTKSRYSIPPPEPLPSYTASLTIFTEHSAAIRGCGQAMFRNTCCHVYSIRVAHGSLCGGTYETGAATG